ncbi:hypothetical protein DCC79_03910 [bacterium]|nr:MAG: hypothetical protein DCC79_03910 [bacterium]
MAQSSPTSPPDLDRLFGPNGALRRHLAGFEPRPSQGQMAAAVWRALEAVTTALIEAPTGTGKSLAYLVPALLSGRRVIVATANKSLQHQLYTKDVPLAARAIGREVDAVVVKGRSNYVCNWKWDRELQAQSLLGPHDPDAEPVQAVRAWLGGTDSGDVDELPVLLGPDLRPRVVSFADDCLHQDCAYALDDCWVNRMRDRAATADVLITNHHLLLSALHLESMGERILPPAPVYVIDEAHHLVDTATAVLEVELTDHAIVALLARKVYRDHVEDDVLESLRFDSRVAFDELAGRHGSAGRLPGAVRIADELPRLRALGLRLRELAQALEARDPYAARTAQAGSVGPAWLAEARAAGGDGGAPEAAAGSDGGPDRVQARMYEQAVGNLGSLADKYLALATARHDDSVVRYAEPVFGRRHVRLALHAAPIAPGAQLAEHLFEAPRRTVICTSATLAAGGGFEHFKERCGLAEAGVELVAPPVFDYPRQALLYQPPLPAYRWDAREAYYAAVAAEIVRLLEVSRGRALCLFTSWDGLQQARAHVDAAGMLPWPLRGQGDAPRDALLAWFRDTPHSVLLATRSFWEGVDIPGDDLSLVVLDKLPFPSPNDPVHQARMAAIDAADGDSFGTYMLPLMTLTLKQGFGRLIRRATDRGVVAILDDRLMRKGYGRKILRDLPPARLTRDFTDVHRFFGAAEGHAADFALSVRAWVDGDDVGAGGKGEAAPAAAADAAGPVRWAYRLCRLLDGRADTADGAAVFGTSGTVAGEALAAARGLDDLRARVARAGRSAADFRVELRCDPATAAVLAEDAVGGALPAPIGAAWAAARDGWAAVAVRPVTAA